ncbi:hypothetical protein C8R46DRAFT_1347001 [Mycena filopes]|nr:hypothetical protein C8R46DRAFT_1347001 [Mycena filopes]
MASTVSPATPERGSRELSEHLLKAVLYHQLIEDRMMPPKDLGLPIHLKHLFPESWNFHFQHAYSQKYGPNSDLKKWKRENPDFGLLSYFGNVNVRGRQQEIRITTKVLLRAEGALITLATRMLDRDGDDFEGAWRALDVERRLELVLDGLVRAAFHARELSRLDCPEMCLFSLAGDKRARGESRDVIELLKTLVAHAPAGNGDITSVYMFSHPAVTREYYDYATDLAALWPPDMRAFGLLRLLQRNLYIVHALMGILNAYSGVPAVCPAPIDEWEAQKRGDGCVGCYSCGATPDVDAVTLLKCSGCRSATYCSSDCQHRDWREHKKLCSGRTVRAEHVDTSVSSVVEPESGSEFIGCPPADAGFVRSAALKQQIARLSKKDSYTQDYHFDVAPGQTRSIRIVHPAERLGFLTMRRRAMASGDPDAVRRMHGILQGAGLVEVTEAQITNQLEREYGLDRAALTSEEGVCAQPTKEDLAEELWFSVRRDRAAEAGKEGAGCENTEEEDSGSDGGVDEEVEEE